MKTTTKKFDRTQVDRLVDLKAAYMKTDEALHALMWARGSLSNVALFDESVNALIDKLCDIERQVDDALNEVDLKLRNAYKGVQ